MKLGLGTVQFGIDYGISNTSGQTGINEVERILRYAEEAGVDTIDTASLYGESEKVLGRTLPENHSFRIITKTPKFSVAESAGAALKELDSAFSRSLSDLGVDDLYCLMIHDAGDLCGEFSDEIYQKLRSYKDKGYIKKIGLSAYDEAQVSVVLDKYAIDVIQIPVNVFDQRLVVSGALKRFKSMGLEIHARSVFLQGVLLMDTVDLPEFFEPARDHHRTYCDCLKDNSLTPLEGALGFVYSLDEIDRVICGVNNLAQFKELADVSENKIGIDFANYALYNNKIVNPVNW